MVCVQESISCPHSPVPASSRSVTAVGIAFSSYEELTAALSSHQSSEGGAMGLAHTCQSSLPSSVPPAGGSPLLSPPMGAEDSPSSPIPSLLLSHPSISFSLPRSLPSCEYSSCP